MDSNVDEGKENVDGNVNSETESGVHSPCSEKQFEETNNNNLVEFNNICLGQGEYNDNSQYRHDNTLSKLPIKVHTKNIFNQNLQPINQTIELSTYDDISNPKTPSTKKSTTNCLDNMESYFPFIYWFRNYKKSYIQVDILAGITCAIILIPQGLAYAKLAELPPVYGLYSSLIPPIIYGLFSTSPSTVIGSFSIISLLIGSSLASAITIMPGETEEAFTLRHNDAAITYSFLCGILFLLLSLFRFGVLTALISDIVLHAFTVGSAFNTSTSQLKSLLGIPVKRGSCVMVLIEVFSKIKLTGGYDTLIGLTSLLLLIILKYINQKFSVFKKIPLPSEIICVIIYTLISYYTNLSTHIPVVGQIDGGLPAFRVPSMENISSLLPGVPILVFITFIVTLSNGKTYENQYPIKVRPNQELFALGIANFVGSFNLCYPVAGSLSRTAVIAGIGVQNPLHNLFSASTLIIVLLFLTPLFYHLPLAVLSAIVISAFINVFSRTRIIYSLYLKRNYYELFVYLVALIMTLVLDTELGLYIGLLTSLLVVLGMYGFSYKYQSKYSFFRYLYLHLGSRYTTTENPKYLMYHFHSNLYYVNSMFNIENISKDIIRRTKNMDEPIRIYVLDFTEVSYIDHSGINQLTNLVNLSIKLEVHLLFYNLEEICTTIIKRYGVDKILLENQIVYDENKIYEYYETYYAENGPRLSKKQNEIHVPEDVDTLIIRNRNDLYSRDSDIIVLPASTPRKLSDY